MSGQLKQSIGLRQTQRLSMTPQLKQAIRMLQLSTMDLADELVLAQETNPLLEITDEVFSEAGENPVRESQTDDSRQDKSSGDGQEGSAGLDSEGISFDEHYNSDITDNPNDYPDSSNHHVIAQGPGSEDFFEVVQNRGGDQVASNQLSLKQWMHSQLFDLFDREEDRLLASYIIEYIDSAGYLTTDLESLVEQLGPEFDVDHAHVEDILRQLQTLEPIGIGARTPEECLLLQLNALPDQHPELNLAKIIVSRHLADLARNDFNFIKRKVGVSSDRLKQAVELIKSLDPHPGNQFDSTNVEYIVPDVVVRKRNGMWFADLNVNALPKLLINQSYQSLIDRHSGNKEYQDMKNQLQEAKWLLSNLEKRHQTILSVAKEIVDRQQDYFHFGAGRLQPLMLKDIASTLGIHESTVSRATSGKYMLTPGGVVELKYFFSRQVNNSGGEITSSTAIQDLIKSLIEQEVPTKPISDSKICEVLNQKGYEIARRTVAKYREQMNIPPSSKRKTL